MRQRTVERVVAPVYARQHPIGGALKDVQLRGLLRGKAGENTPFSGRGYAPGAKGSAALSAAMPASSVSLGSEPFGRAIGDFYLSNPVARASRTMAECSALATSLDTAVAAE